MYGGGGLILPSGGEMGKPGFYLITAVSCFYGRGLWRYSASKLQNLMASNRAAPSQTQLHYGVTGGRDTQNGTSKNALVLRTARDVAAWW